MAKLAKKAVFTTTGSQKETALDKTTRVVRRINDEEARIRHDKMAHLRKARFENEEGIPVEETAAQPEPAS